MPISGVELSFGESFGDLTPAPVGGRPHIVIVGAGFAGLACAQALGGTQTRVTIVDRQNYHLFVPLLYQVATASLSPANIAAPIRKILRRHDNIDVLMTQVTGIDVAAKRVLADNGGYVPYDYLVLATGSQYNYFAHGEWAAHAPGLKTVADARRIRASILRGFEQAEASVDPERRRAMTTTVIVGGGPTGVEMAGAVAELARWSLRDDFRRIRPESATIMLVEAGPRILGGFPEEQAAYARDRLERLGVVVRTGTTVEEVDGGGVNLPGERVDARTVVWAAGIAAAPAARWIGVDGDRLGRIPVADDLSVPGRENVFAIGDLALLAGGDGRPLPALAQVAKQQGRHLGRALAARAGRGTPLASFRFRNRGNTAVVGRGAAIFDFGQRQLRGRIAWLLWAFVHVYLLIAFEQRLLVSIQWLWRWLTYERGARLISSDADDPVAPAIDHDDASPKDA